MFAALEIATGRVTQARMPRHRPSRVPRLPEAGGQGLPDVGVMAEHGRDFFGIITRQAIRRGTHRSVRELVEAIGRFIDGWNDRCEPFVWTKTADEILTHARSGPRASFTRR